MSFKVVEAVGASAVAEEAAAAGIDDDGDVGDDAEQFKNELFSAVAATVVVKSTVKGFK